MALGRAVECITSDSAKSERKAVGCICVSCFSSHRGNVTWKFLSDDAVLTVESANRVAHVGKHGVSNHGPCAPGPRGDKLCQAIPANVTLKAASEVGLHYPGDVVQSGSKQLFQAPALAAVTAALHDQPHEDGVGSDGVGEAVEAAEEAHVAEAAADAEGMLQTAAETNIVQAAVQHAHREHALHEAEQRLPWNNGGRIINVQHSKNAMTAKDLETDVDKLQERRAPDF